VIVDELAVAVVADDSKLPGSVRAAFRGADSTFTSAGRDAAQRFDGGFRAGTKLDSPLRDARARFVAQARQSGDDAGEGFGDGFQGASESANRPVLSGMRSLGAKAAGVLGAAIVAAGIGTAVTGAITDSLDLQAGQARLQAQLGATAEQAGRLGKIAGDLYKGNFGSSVADVNEGLRATLQSGILQPGAADSALEGITSKVLSLRDTFDQDLTGSVRAAGQLVRTGLARDAGDALDLITRGFQTGAGSSDDFLETLTEYPTQFRKLGLSGAQAVGLLSQGMRAGARDSDIVADAIKEFSIRAIDGSTLTAQGFKALGLSAKTMGTAIGRGGDIANEALDVTLDRLRGIKDPVKQSQAAVALFGTQAEDLGAALFALDPSNAVQTLGKVGGAADEMTRTLGGTASSNLESFKRQVSSTFTQVIGGQLLPGLTSVSKYLATGFGPALETARGALRNAFRPGGAGENGASAGPLATLLAQVQGFGAQVGPALGAAGQTLAQFGAALLPTLQGIGREILGVVGPALADFGALISGEIVPAFQAFLPAITPVAKFLLEVIGGAVVGALKGAVTAIKGAMTLIAGILNVFAALFTGDWSRLWKGLKQILSGVLQTLLGAVQVFLNVGLLRAFKLGLTLLKGIFTGGLRAITGLWSSALDGLGGLARSGLRAIGNLIVGAVRGYIGLWRGGLTTLRNVVAGLLTRYVDLWRSVPGRIIGLFRTAGGALVSAGRDMVQGLLNGAGQLLPKIGQFFLDKLPGWIRGPFEKALGISSPSRVFARYGLNITQGLARGLDAGGKTAQDAVTRLAGGVQARWEAAQQRLTDVLGERVGFLRQIRDAAVSATDITNVEAPTPTGLVKGLRQQLAEVTAFRKNMRRLIGEGLNATTLRQLADAGVERGGAAARALIQDGGRTIAEVNRLQARIGRQATLLGQVTSGRLFEAGVAAARGLVRGLSSQRRALLAAADDMGKKIAAAVRKALGIRSPSTVMRDVADNITGTLADRLEAGAPRVTLAAGRVAAATFIEPDLSHLAALATSQARATLTTAGAAPGRPAREAHYNIDARGMDRSELLATVRAKESLDEILYGQEAVI
jgi:phage-related minor tail protein